MVNCNMFWGLSVTAPNLTLLRCVKPTGQAPSFKDLGSLVAGTIILDDYCFSDDFEDFSKDELDETTDDDDDCTRDDEVGVGYHKNRKCKTKPMVMSDYESDGDTSDDESDGETGDDELDETSDDDSDDGKKRKRKAGAGYGFGLPQKMHRPGGYKDDRDYGSDIESDDNTFEYSDIANDCDESIYDGVGQSSGKDGRRQVYGENSGSNDCKVLGGDNVLQSLSNATSLELLADAGENMNIRKLLETGVKPTGRSFACKHLQMVKIKCSKDDVRVHKLARLFTSNGVPVEKIFVRRTGSTYLRGKKMMKDLARQELKFWGDD